MSEIKPIKRALVSVYDKTGLDKLAKSLQAAGVEIISTGSTAHQIAAAGVEVTEVSQVTGFPECLDGRVKTLHPLIHAGILANRELPTHVAQLEELKVTPIDLVVCNLYPFADTVASGAGFADCIEKIDIGGPSMIRAAAKNHADVAVIVDPSSYDDLAAALQRGGFTAAERRELAAKAFNHTAIYDTQISSWFAKQLQGEDAATTSSALPNLEQWKPQLKELHSLRYGENPHQEAAVYRFTDEEGGLAQAEQLGGKPMSYNNYTDADAAWRAATDHSEPCVAVIKHANPCGIAIAEDVAQAHLLAHGCDPLSAYGGVIACNREVTLKMAQQVKPIFTEVIIAPEYEVEALELLQTKKNLRILRIDADAPVEWEFRQISGGVLAQTRDRLQAEGDNPENWTLAAGPAADEATLADLAFAWKTVRAVKSNAILLAKNQATVGIGMGQVNRVDSCALAVQRANTLGQVPEGQAAPERARGSVAASDAFFPFADGPQTLIEAGVKAIVQPGGSIRDEETIKACQDAGVTLYLTGTRHFWH